MFGRYSLDVEGLVLADQGDAVEDYLAKMPDPDQVTFMPDADNVIPLTEDGYFEDDLVSRLVEFVRTVYGDETLEENLAYIADALGGKGDAREAIRSYFLKDFFKDHCKTYKKTPIYWLVDAGRKNSFKAIFYMHRYRPDLMARIRTGYVHPQQEHLRSRLAGIEDELAAAKGRQRTSLMKEQKRLRDQEQELVLFEERIHTLADQMIEIDLDDGVMANYPKFQSVLAKIK